MNHKYLLHWSGIFYLQDFLSFILFCKTVDSFIFAFMWQIGRLEMILSRILNPPNVDESSKFTFNPE